MAGHDAWTAVIPVKGFETAKSRLASVGEVRRRGLAWGFAKDVITVATSTPTVARTIVVTTDEDFGRWSEALGAEWVAEVRSEPPSQPPVPFAALNAAIRLGASRATGPAFALAADLPAIRPELLAAVLDSALAYGRSFVADADGSGTALLAARVPDQMNPHFGIDSASRHRESGAIDITESAATGLRRDVDTEDDLRQAIRLGVGPWTEQALEQK